MNRDPKLESDQKFDGIFEINDSLPKKQQQHWYQVFEYSSQFHSLVGRNKFRIWSPNWIQIKILMKYWKPMIQKTLVFRDTLFYFLNKSNSANFEKPNLESNLEPKPEPDKNRMKYSKSRFPQKPNLFVFNFVLIQIRFIFWKGKSVK